MTSLVSTKLRNSAKGQPCTLMIPGVCCCDTETTVLAHLYPFGHSMGAKSPDYLACFACAECHEHLDQHRATKAEELFFAFRGMALTWANWISRGLIVIPVDPETAKRRPKKKWTRESRPLPGTKASGLRRRMNGSVEKR